MRLKRGKFYLVLLFLIIGLVFNFNVNFVGAAELCYTSDYPFFGGYDGDTIGRCGWWESASLDGEETGEDNAGCGHIITSNGDLVYCDAGVSIITGCCEYLPPGDGAFQGFSCLNAGDIACYVDNPQRHVWCCPVGDGCGGAVNTCGGCSAQYYNML